MTPAQRRSLSRRLHRWLGAATAALLLLVTATGILLHHRHWLGPAPDRPQCLAVDPADPRHLLRGTRWGVERSEDAGHTWQSVPMLAPPTDVRRILFVAGARGDGLVFALGTQSGVVSTDGGRIWRDMDLPVPADPARAEFLDLTCALNGEQTLLTTHGTYRRTGTGPWRAVGPPPPLAPDRHRLVHDLHTGRILGEAGRQVVAVGAWGVVLLTLSGLVLFARRGGRRTP